jgi:large subunit ribosomal protein L2
MKFLKKGLIKTGGRNNRGKITSYHKGGGHKRLYRFIDFKFKFEQGLVISIEYDPNRSCKIALIKDIKTDKFFYIIAPLGLQKGNLISSDKIKNFKPGDFSFIQKMPIGSKIFNLELFPGQGSKLVKSAGTFAKIIQKQKKYSKILLPSKEQRLILNSCKAVFGEVSTSFSKNINKKAGRSRWLNKRPIVRGVAMNPIDHPHGGGEGKTSGGRCSVTPWGKLTKGKKTTLKLNKLITKRRC